MPNNMPSYTSNDLNMLNYLSSSIEKYVLNNFVRNVIINIVPKISTLIGQNGKPLGNFKTPPKLLLYFDNFYLNPNNPPVIPPTPTPLATAGVTYYDSTTFALNPVVNYITLNPVFSISEDSLFRISTGILNMTFDPVYLNMVPGATMFTSKLLYEDNVTKFIKIISIIAPKIFIEICNSYVNSFFVTYFKDVTDTPYTAIPSPQTENDINSWCVSTGCMDTACAKDKSNKRCACLNCYNKHPEQMMLIADVMNKSDVTMDPWCLYPGCASGDAYKNKLDLERSICSNISVAGMFVNPTEYSNVNITNSSVSASAFNSNGVNIISGTGCSSCKKSQDCKIVDTFLQCVDRKPENTENTENTENLQKTKLGKSTGKSKIGKTLMIIFGSIIIVLILMIILSKKYSGIKYFSELALVSFVGLFIFSIILYFTTKEKYIYPEDIVSLTAKCTNENSNNCFLDSSNCSSTQTCINGLCSLYIGKFKGNVNYPENIPSDIIIYNLPYLPYYIYTGTYMYSVVVNNIIYVIANYSTFKFDGDKWIELSNSSSQLGFSPYIPKKEYGLAISESHGTFSSGSYFLYNNEIYTPIEKSDPFQSYNFNIYNIATDTWRITNFNVDNSKLQTSTGTGPSFRLSIIYQDILYLFGGVSTTVDIATSTIIKIDLSASTTKPTYVNNPAFNSLIVHEWSYAFVFYSQIYLCNVSLTSSEGTIFQGIVSFDYNNNSFSPITAISFPKNITNVTNVLYNFNKSDSMLRIIYDNNYYRINLSKPTDIVDNNPILERITIPTYAGTGSIYTKLYPALSNCFVINDNLFLVTESGEIFRICEYTDTTTKKISIYMNPCYPITNFERSIENQILQN